MSMARRAIGLESDEKARLGYCALFEKEAFDIDPLNPLQTSIFPEMDENVHNSFVGQSTLKRVVSGAQLQPIEPVK